MESISRSLSLLVSPSANEASKALQDALVQHRTVLVVGRCWVHYRGRASSRLEPGERMLIVKEDGSLMVHRSVGYEPVNWQPPGCVFHSEAKDNVLKLHALRRKPLESVRVYFDRIYLLSAFDLVDSGEFSLYASEEDMQKAILAEPSLLEEGFEPISFEKKVDPGFIDVYGVDGNGNLVVVEIKRKSASKQAVIQLSKYVKSIESGVNRGVRGILVAPSITRGVQTLLERSQLEFKPLDPKRCESVLRKTKDRKLETFFTAGDER